ncbi:hypothetical protein CEXT_613151 [Caerostris extrusa]|uniref:Uncharacterized protein n=1 Tax=Caerostris extrusa TaxID=172846 RepID=A0AAV4RNH0_CAEEX|nr:hypothetical protein CEXT_613151 [Caerostris extrusa]
MAVFTVVTHRCHVKDVKKKRIEKTSPIFNMTPMVTTVKQHHFLGFDSNDGCFTVVTIGAMLKIGEGINTHTCMLLNPSRERNKKLLCIQRKKLSLPMDTSVVDGLNNMDMLQYTNIFFLHWMDETFRWKLATFHRTAVHGNVRLECETLLNYYRTVTRLGNDPFQTSPKAAQLSRNLSAQRYMTVTRLKSIYRYWVNLETVGFWLDRKLLSSQESLSSEISKF